MSKGELIKELERLKNESETYSNNTVVNMVYRAAMLDAIKLVKKITLPDAAKELLSDENIIEMALKYTGGHEDYQGFVLACYVIANELKKQNK